MDGSRPETCAECGFDARQWRVRDAATLFGALGFWWRLAIADVDLEILNRRPAPAVWSVLEYGRHSSAVTAVIRSALELMLAEDGRALGTPALSASAIEGNEVVLGHEAVLDALEREGQAMAALAGRQSAPWGNVGKLPDATIQAEAALLHAAHDVSHHFMDVGRGLAALGGGTPAAQGRVAQLNVSAGGVPKLDLGSDEAVIGWRGIEGDRQADHKHHGRPFQALCLWSTEVIAELAAAGHPIAAGCAGENVTLAGLEWASLRPGARLRVGTALVELSHPAVPCQKQTRWFADGDFARISYERNPAWVRWYGWVREQGRVRAGDAVIVQP